MLIETLTCFQNLIWRECNNLSDYYPTTENPSKPCFKNNKLQNYTKKFQNKFFLTTKTPITTTVLSKPIKLYKKITKNEKKSLNKFRFNTFNNFNLTTTTILTLTTVLNETNKIPKFLANSNNYEWKNYIIGLWKKFRQSKLFRKK